MPRQSRLDTPRALHHVMAGGIDGIKIFGRLEDREDFLWVEGQMKQTHNRVAGRFSPPAPTAPRMEFLGHDT